MPTLDFKGKQHIYAHHLSVPYRQLIPDESKSVSSGSDSGNLIIHGDNLHALKALMPTHSGRIKCVYIDPPYNTGSQSWVFNDNVNSPLMRQWLSENKPVDGEDLERHDKWLCMMWPRLQMLRELLTDDGVIFVSIDDHEQHRLRMVMDEIFGAECFVACPSVVTNLRGSRDNRGFTTAHEYVLVYEKEPGRATFKELPLTDDERSDWRQDAKGWYKKGAHLRYSGEDAAREKRPNLFFPIYVSSDGQVGLEQKHESDEELWPIGSDGRELRWRWSRDRIATDPDELITIRTSAGWALHKKQRPVGGEEPTKKPKSSFYSPNYSSTTATNVVKQIFDGERAFDYPHSHHFVADLLTIASVNENDIVLDSFAGSGTTAHAVLQLNQNDGVDRRFILVECENYADTITSERVRRVMEGVPDASDVSLRVGTNGGFTYCTLGDEIGIESMLTGENLPDYASLAAYLLYCATGLAVASTDLANRGDRDDGFFHETERLRYHMFYEPNTEWLRGSDGALNYERATRISSEARRVGKKSVVFAPVKFVSHDDISSLDITFCQLPYELTASRAQALEM